MSGSDLPVSTIPRGHFVEEESETTGMVMHIPTTCDDAQKLIDIQSERISELESELKEIADKLDEASQHLKGSMTTAQKLTELIRSRKSFADMWKRVQVEMDELEKLIDLLEASHKELLEALKNLVNGNDMSVAKSGSMQSWPDSDFRREAKSAIASAEKLMEVLK